MHKIKALETEYRSKKRAYEEQEEELSQQRNKAIAIIEEVEDRSHYYLKDAVPDNTMLMQGYRQTEQMKEDVLELTKEKQKELSRKIEKLDENYYRTFRKLKANKK